MAVRHFPPPREMELSINEIGIVPFPRARGCRRAGAEAFLTWIYLDTVSDVYCPLYFLVKKKIKKIKNNKRRNSKFSTLSLTYSGLTLV